MQPMNYRWTPLMLAALLGVAACGERSDTQTLAAARDLMARHDHAAAVIELKDLLQRSPQSGEARFLLGKLQFAANDPAGAQAELQRALDAGHSQDEVLPLMAAVLLALDKAALVVAQYANVDLGDALAAAELKTQLATAQMSVGATDEAAQSVAKALQLAADYAPALVVRARLKAAGGDTAAALAQIDELLASAPSHAAAWMLKGELLWRAAQAVNAPAIEAYRKALALQPDLVAAHVAVLRMLIAQGDFAGAATQWGGLKKALPNHPQTKYFEAVLALQKGNPTRAREITQQQLRSAPENLLLLLLASQAELQLGASVKAETLLIKATQVAPRDATPRHMLADAYLRSGQAGLAMSTLKPLLDAKDAKDADALALAGRAQLMSGDAKAAEASFAKARKLKPDDQRIRTSAALAQLGRGQSDAAFVELEAVATADTGSTADLALISARLMRKEFDAALKAVDSLAAKQPQQALPDYLRGRIALQRNDKAAARKSFDAALVKQAGYFPAVASLAALDVGEGKPDAARARFEALRESEPGNAQVRLALATLIQRGGGGSRQEVLKLLDEAVSAKPADANVRSALIAHHLDGGDTELALAAAQSAVAALPDNFALLDRLGHVQLARGDAHQAIRTFSRMAELRPKSELPQVGLAEAYLANKQLDAAAAAARRANQAAPTSLPAQRVGVVTALRQKQPAKALAIARAVQSQRPNEAVGFILEGDIESALRNHDGAVAAFRKALTKANSADAAKRLHLALLSAKKPAEANTMAEAWLKDHPDDLAFLVQLGDTALGQKDLSQAEKRYREVLKRQPDNALAMNNVAYLMAKMNKPGAMELAERAAKLAPRQPAVLDTLALIYADAKQYDKAIEWQLKAVELAPGSGGLRLTLAKLYLQAKEHDKARAELTTLAGLGSAFIAHAEVAQLLKQLGG